MRVYVVSFMRLGAQAADTVQMAVRQQSLKADPLLTPLEAQG